MGTAVPLLIGMAGTSPAMTEEKMGVTIQLTVVTDCVTN
jgi:hypothetical protein